MTREEFMKKPSDFKFSVNPLDVNLAKMQFSLLEKFRREVSSQTEGYSAKECYESKSPVLHVKEVILECLQSRNYSWEYSLWLTVTENGGERQEEYRLMKGSAQQMEAYLDSPAFMTVCKGYVLYFDYIFKTFTSFQDYVDDVIQRVIKRVEAEVPDTGDFMPVIEFFTNPSSKTRDDVGRYGLRVYKMRKDIVPDPSKRYVEAAAYDPSGCYKADFVVASGTKDEILAKMVTEEFSMKLCDDYANLTDLMHDA